MGALVYFESVFFCLILIAIIVADFKTVRDFYRERFLRSIMLGFCTIHGILALYYIIGFVFVMVTKQVLKFDRAIGRVLLYIDSEPVGAHEGPKPDLRTTNPLWSFVVTTVAILSTLEWCYILAKPETVSLVLVIHAIINSIPGLIVQTLLLKGVYLFLEKTCRVHPKNYSIL